MPDTGFLFRTAHLEGQAFRHVVYVPPRWTPERAWPVILFLHGVGERGSDGLRQTAVGLPAVIRLQMDRYPAIVVMPQCLGDRGWHDPLMERQALAALDAAVAEFHGDPDRVIAAGLSLGGYGVLRYAARHPQRFAAVVSVCGGIVFPPVVRHLDPDACEGGVAYAEAAERLKHIPSWLFHGAEDGVVPAEESRRLAAELEQRGAPSHYTEYASLGHAIWDLAFQDPRLIDWIFAARRGQAH
ncbi:MAG: prolyl oligopeptidase family serine peptidase [Bryobacter sp.]|nr:prolyl oligopeptidase family serine peptidase [Bryobacter sp.]